MARCWSILQFAATVSLFMCLRGQPEASQTQANECRHVAILASPDRNGSYTARCFIPTNGSYSISNSLSDMIPDEWRWVYEHNGSISGQVMVRTNNSVYILSQKNCWDLGKARARPAHSVYGSIGGNRPRTDVYGNFSGIPRLNLSREDVGEGPDLNHTKNNDAYAECVFDYSPLSTYRSWNSNKAFPDEMAQMVKTVKGGHTGEGQTLTEYYFRYSEKTLNEAFRMLVGDAIRNEPVGNETDVRINPRYPITLNNYAYETGLSVVGPRSAAESGKPKNDFFRDNSNLGWHRMLQAKSALSNQLDPPPPLPDEFKPNDLISFTLLYIVVAFLCERALKDAVKMRQNAIRKWDNPTGQWSLLEPKTKYGKVKDKKLTRAKALLDRIFWCNSRGLLRESRAGTLDVVCAFVTGIGSMMGAVLEFNNSAYRHQYIFLVNSGGVITYGPSLEHFSIDKNNSWAGAEFSVNHWMVLNILEIGNRWVVPLVYSVYAMLFLYVCRAYFVYSLRREHDLDFWIFRTIYRPVKWTGLLVQKLIARRIAKGLNESNQIVGLSYENVYEGVFNKLADSYGYKRLMPEEKPKARGFLTCFERFKIDRCLPNRTASRPRTGMSAGLTLHDTFNAVSRNQIEKCAEVLAADRFGLLGRNQALTLMYTEGAAKAANRFVTENQLPDSREIQQLSLIYYVRHVVIPDGEGKPISPEDFDYINVGGLTQGNSGAKLSDFVSGPDKENVICPVIGYRPREEDADRAACIDPERSSRQLNSEANEDWKGDWFSGNVIYISLNKSSFEVL